MVARYVYWQDTGSTTTRRIGRRIFCREREREPLPRRASRFCGETCRKAKDMLEESECIGIASTILSSSASVQTCIRVWSYASGTNGLPFTDRRRELTRVLPNLSTRVRLPKDSATMDSTRLRRRTLGAKGCAPTRGWHCRPSRREKSPST